MAFIVVGNYAFPAPLAESYEVTCEPIIRFQTNTRGVRIGEFQRFQTTIRWAYDRDRLSIQEYSQMAIALKNGTPGLNINPISVTYWDPDTNSFMTGNFLASKTEPKYYKHEKMSVVQFELVEQ